MFVPTEPEELKKLGWNKLDVIIVTGDAYIDVPHDGAAVISKVLIDAGYKVGVVSQPRLDTPGDITKFGEPLLFWGVTAGCTDSMLANYTALLKKRRSDDLTPGGVNNRRPDRASIRYANLIREHFKDTVPIILGGVEASLRRIAHYDYNTDKIRGSILFDSKADAIVYGEGERTVLQIAERLSKSNSFNDLRGLCYGSREVPNEYLQLPSYEEVKSDKLKFVEMFDTFYKNNDPLNSTGLAQKHGARYLIQNPPQYRLEPEELDRIHELDFERRVPKSIANRGKVKALATVKFSIISNRGCFGECNFCGIAVHQGRRVVSRSEESILREARKIARRKDFNGIISDVGGPTANAYGAECSILNERGGCKKKKCLTPKLCKQLSISHERQLKLLKKLRSIKGVKRVFIGSGIRYDSVVRDDKFGRRYLEDLVEHHISGQLKIAPEHTDEDVLRLMGKPPAADLSRFVDDFYKITKNKKKKRYLTYYFIAGHPGCDMSQMQALRKYVRDDLKIRPEQVQIFTPTPSTYSTLMYYLGFDPVDGKKVFVEKSLKKKKLQKDVLFR